MFGTSVRLVSLIFIGTFLVFAMPRSASAESLLSLCNETDETLYIARRTENGLLTGGGFITDGWIKLSVRGIFRSCYRTNVAKGWTKHFVVAVARGNGFVPMKMDFRGTGYVKKSRMCVSTHLGEFSYRSSNRNSDSCSAGYVLVQATVNVSGGDRDATLDLYGSIARDAQPVAGVEPTKEELAAAKAREKKYQEAKRQERLEAAKRAKKKKEEEKREEERIEAAQKKKLEQLSAMTDTEIFLEMRKKISEKDEKTRSTWESALTDNIVALCQSKNDLNDVLVLDSFPKEKIGIGLFAIVSNDSWLPTPKQIREVWGKKSDEEGSISKILSEMKYVKDPKTLKYSYLRNELVRSRYWEADKNKSSGYIGWTVEMFKDFNSKSVSSKREPHLCIHNGDKTPLDSFVSILSTSPSICFALKLRSRMVEGRVPIVDIVRRGLINTKLSHFFSLKPIWPVLEKVHFEDIMNCARN